MKMIWVLPPRNESHNPLAVARSFSSYGQPISQGPFSTSKAVATVALQSLRYLKKKKEATLIHET